MVWHKTNPAPKFRRAGFLNSCELIVCLWNKGHTWNFTKQNEMHNFIESPICMGKERLKKPKHPTQKPVKIMKKLIEIASNEGDTILDPFSGVGSTGIAALELNRKFIGIESDEEYFKASCIRLDQKYRELQESSNL
jgi:site-specific DNA-methyltransferase (adenine-specific)/modification methylase